MIDFDADAELMDELTALTRHPAGAARTRELEQLLSEADEENLVHSGIFARCILAAELMMANADDLTGVLGLFAESQQLMRRHQDVLVAEAFGPVLLHMQLTLALLLEHPEVPLDRIEAVRGTYEQMCRQNGMTLRGAYSTAMRIAARRGDHSATERLFALSQAQPRDRMVIADTVEHAIDWYAARGQYVEALGLYERATAEDERHYYRYVQVAALMPALHCGRDQLAAQLYDDSLDPDDIDSGDAPRLTYLALTGRYDDGVALLPQVLKPTDYDTDRSRAFAAEHAVVLLSHLEAAGRGGDRVAGLDGTVSELLAHCRSLAEETARTVDRVNSMDVAVRRLHGFWDEHTPAATRDRRVQAVSTTLPPTAAPPD